MCGIAGIAYSTRSGRVADRAVAERMGDALIHRGPDAAGTFVEGRVALAHRRLSIVDLARGQQPMASADDRLMIVYNGEVYNHPVLRNELRAQGVGYRTNCDTETVLNVFVQSRADAPRRLRGMFAFAIWDRATQELFLARDRFGVKPLYYALDADGSIRFASEIKSLLVSGVAPALNVDALPDYLANHAPSGDETLYAGIRRVPPGHVLIWRDGTTQLVRYWDLSFVPSADDERSLNPVEEYRERLYESVRMRLMADVPLGVFLSGGIDSAAITAAMSHLVGDGVKSFSVAFREREANELEYARLVARHCKTEHHEVVVTAEQFFRALPRLVWHEDEPIAHPSSVALWFVSVLASEHVKVVLTGEGSDETLAGYGRYPKTIYNLRLGTTYEAIAAHSIRRFVRAGIGAMPSGSALRRKLSRTFLYWPTSIDSLYLENFAVFPTWEQERLLTPALRRQVVGHDPYGTARRLFAECDSSDVLDRLLYVDTKTYLHELLMKQDQMSMAASIESRVPFLDHPLVEYVARLPRRYKLRMMTTKYVLRQAMRDILPAPIISRRKMGFPVPIAAWLRGPFTHVLDEFVLGARARARGLFDPVAVADLVRRHRAGEDHAQRLWSLLNFEIWQRIASDGEPVEAIHVA